VSVTGRLGAATSRLGTLELGAEGGEAVETQTLQLRANIQGVITQSLQLRANILGVSSQSLDMRAYLIGPAREIQMRAFIVRAASLQMRAAILQTFEADLNVTFDALVPVEQRLMVRYQVGDKEPNYKAIQMRANIVQTVTADLTVRFQVDYDHMPTDCIGRPKTRVYVTEN
jgi:hypothetical protein